jgi:polar amino acid transport system substrate-binding protein
MKKKLLGCKAVFQALTSLALVFSIGVQAADLAEIEKRGALKIATEDDYAPFNFITDGKPDGFHKDILDELGAVDLL